MKKQPLIICLILVITFSLKAQTNTFPNSGNVGVGTVSPTDKLEVVGDITLQASSASNDGPLRALKFFNGYTSSNSVLAQIQARRGNGSHQKGDLAFYVKNGTSLIEALRILANGNVGIGTTNPTAGIQIEKAIPVDFIASLKNTDTGASSNGLKVEVSNSSTNNTVQRWLVNNSEIMRVRADGNVGIGTTNPSEKLHVNGNIGIGAMSGTNEEGFRVDYLDGGSGITTFKSNRWGGDIYFKRNSSLGERNQFLFGGASNHYMNIYDNNNQVKVRLISSGNSYINGGNVGIGTTTPDSKLSVNGNIHTKEVKVDLIGWSDFVFENDYDLPTLKEVEQYIKEKGHLQDIPSAKEVSENGIFLGEMDSKLLQKIEELTLYTIEQQKEIEAQNSKIQKLEKENIVLKLLANKIELLQQQIEKLK